MDEWPKKYKLYAHGNRETNRMLGEHLGMGEEAVRLLRHALTEIVVYASVNKDGTYRADAIELDGVLVGPSISPDELRKYKEYHG